MNENFEAVGFESIYLINNMGTVAVVYVIWILLAVFTKLLKLFRNRSPKVNSVHAKLRRKLYYNSLISLFIESYSILAVCCLINLFFLDFSSFGLSFHSFACIIFLLAITLIPIILARYLIKNWNRLSEPKMITRYGNLYNELDLKSSKIVLSQPAFFLLRRLMIAIAIVIVN